MKKTARNCILSIVCGAAVLASASCATGVTYPVTVDGEPIRAGIYILKQQDSLSEAYNKLEEEQPDLDTSATDFDYFAQTVEGKKFGDWVNDEAVEKCRVYVATERLFDQYGLSLSDSDISDIDKTARQFWTEENEYAQYYYGVSVIGDYYEKYGVGEQSFKDYEYNSRKKSILFDHLYGEGGELAATQDEINEVLQKDYLTANYFTYELESGDSAQSYADKITAGTSYEEVYKEYSQAKADADYAQKKADAEAAAKAAEENGEEYIGEDIGEPTTVELAEKDSLIRVIRKSDNSPSEDFVNQVSAMNAGEVKVVTVSKDDGTSTVYVVQKIDILSVPATTTYTVNTIRSELKEDEFEQMLKSKGDELTLTTDSSINLYKPEKLIER